MTGYAVTLRLRRNLPTDAAWTVAISSRTLALLRSGALLLIAAVIFLGAPIAMAALAARDSADSVHRARPAIAHQVLARGSNDRREALHKLQRRPRQHQGQPRFARPVTHEALVMPSLSA